MWPFAFVRRYAGMSALAASMVAWGSLPLYWDLLDGAPPVLILFQRMFWSFIFIVPLALLLGQARAALDAFRSWRVVRILILSSVILAGNWLLYIWAVLDGQVLATSLGYYIMPLLNVGVGILFFGDRPRRAQCIAIGLVAAGVAVQIALAGTVPWVALGLAVSFCVYGLLRKVVPVESLAGLTVETSLLALPALAGILWWRFSAGVVFPDSAQVGRDLLFIGSGVITTLPLVWFAYGVRHLPLVTVGIVQYLSPTISFSIGVFVLREPFALTDALSFGCIWAALALYTLDGLRFHKTHN